MTTVMGALGRLAGWTPDEQAKFNAMMQSFAMIIAGVGTQNYYTAAAGAINLISLMLAPSGGSDGFGVILSNLHQLRSELNRRLDQPLTWETKRRVVETLVDSIRVETVGAGAERDTHVTVSYRFGVPQPSTEGPALAHRASGSVRPVNESGRTVSGTSDPRHRLK